MGLRFTTTGDTLCNEGQPILLEKIDFPEPVISIAIEPKTKADQEKLGNALSRLAMEDPSFRITTNEETGQTLISGMGELHLEIIVDRMRREFKVDGNVGPSASRVSRDDSEFRALRRQIHPPERGQRSVRPCCSRPQAQRARQGIHVPQYLKGGVIPKEFIPAIEKGVSEAMLGGIITGYPAVDIHATLVDGSFHDVDSSEIAYKIAASMAFKDGAKSAKPVLLEPMMSCEVVCPDEYMGGVIGDLNSRRGKVLNMSMRHNLQVIKAEVPLATMFGYSTALRSSSQGRATYSMEFSHYEPVPPAVAHDILVRAGVIIVCNGDGWDPWVLPV